MDVKNSTNSWIWFSLEKVYCQLLRSARRFPTKILSTCCSWWTNKCAFRVSLRFKNSDLIIYLLYTDDPTTYTTIPFCQEAQFLVTIIEIYPCQSIAVYNPFFITCYGIFKGRLLFVITIGSQKRKLLMTHVFNKQKDFAYDNISFYWLNYGRLYNANNLYLPIFQWQCDFWSALYLPELGLFGEPVTAKIWLHVSKFYCLLRVAS